MLRVWQKRLRVTNIQDKNLIDAIASVQRICNNFNVSDFIKECFPLKGHLYKNVSSRNITKAKSVASLVKAIVYILAIKNKIPVILEQINRISKVKKRRITQ